MQPFMKTKREEKLEETIALLRAELRATKAHLRDVKKSKETFKARSRGLQKELAQEKKSQGLFPQGKLQ